MSPIKHLIFAGAGHAHLFALSRISEYVKSNIRVTVISPGTFWYSGMGPGMLSGTYADAEDRVDVERLVTYQGGKFLEDRVSEIVPHENYVLTESGKKLEYHALSLNLGSAVDDKLVEPGTQNVYPVKPISNFLRVRERILQKADSPEPLKLVVIGGGASGCEAAAAAYRLSQEVARPTLLTLVHSSHQVLDEHPRRARKIMQEWLDEQEIKLKLGSSITRIENQKAFLEDGTHVSFDIAILATGVRPPHLLKVSPLRTAIDGSLVVNNFLQSVTYPNVFGAGDCVSLENQELDRVGVHALKEGPVLHHNLLAYFNGLAMKRYEPQKRYLLILNLSDETGLAIWDRLAIRHPLAFKLKNYLDLQFTTRYQKTVVEKG